MLTTKGTNTPLTWKLTGNLGGENHQDKFRGPLNEGGLYFERQGFHLPGTPPLTWATSSPVEGIDQSGITFNTSTFSLNIVTGDWDIPLSLVFSNDTLFNGRYRTQLYINGWQFGRLGHLGPQYDFPVSEGILNYQGENHIAVSL